MSNNIAQAQLVVIGAGPGGYTAAFRAADLGLEVTIIDKANKLGGVCLNSGCIPSKSLLHLSKIIHNSRKSKNMGITFSEPEINVVDIQLWKNKIIENLNSGIEKLAVARKIKIINGLATFQSANEILISNKQNKLIKLTFDHCIIATGSKSQKISHLYKNHPSILDSSSALNFDKIPNSLLVIGGGYIGLELGTVFSSFGSQITIAEFLPNLLSMADDDLVRPLYNSLKLECKNIFLSTEVTSLIPQTDNTIIAQFKKDGKEFKDSFDKVLLCTGRIPNTSNLNINKTGIQLDDKGFIPVNKQRRTLIPNIYAIGDVTGDPMLAHKATYEGKIAAESINGQNSVYNPVAIPSVIFTHPEIAWAGYTEKELNKNSVKYNKSDFPWTASGRAMSVNATIGKTKILTNENKTEILGVGIVGENAGDLISEAMLAMEMKAIPEDIVMTIHPHPTLSETLENAAEILTGTITDLYIPKK